MIHRGEPKFIFVHIPKTGGSSIEVSLAETLLKRKLRQNTGGLTFPDRSELRELSRSEAKEFALPFPRLTRQHFSLAQYEQTYRADVARLFTFAFVRNPWDLVVSEILYFQRNEGKTFNVSRFPEAVERLVKMARKRKTLWGHTFLPQSEFLRDKRGNISVEFVGRFESLESDFASVCKRLGTPPQPLPHLMASGRKAHYSSFYDSKSIELVAEHYSEDIARFAYRYESVRPKTDHSCSATKGWLTD